MATTIVLKNSVTTTNVPSSLTQGEVAVNVTDKKVWVGNAATTPILLVNGGSDGVFTSVTDSGLTNTRLTYAGASGLLKDSANITTDGTILTATKFSGALNGTVGATTPADGKFTTLNASSTLGVGTSTLSGQLTVKAASGQGTPLNLLSTDAGANAQIVFTGNRTYQLGTGNSGSGFADVLYFYDGTAGAERMRIGSGGGVYIGRTTGGGTLNLQGELWLYGQPTGAGTNTLKYNITNGQVTYDISARHFKENIEDLKYGLASVMEMKPRKYVYKSTKAVDIGFIADEMYPLIPEVTPLANNSINDSGVPDGEPVSINYDRLTAVLVKAIQELNTKVDAQAAEIAALKAGV